MATAILQPSERIAVEITFGHLQIIQLYMRTFLIILQRGLTILSVVIFKNIENATSVKALFLFRRIPTSPISETKQGGTQCNQTTIHSIITTEETS